MSSKTESTPSEFSNRLPGTEPLPDDLIQAFIEKKDGLGMNYQPRTRHKADTGFAKFTNRLFLETSPYLQQHAHNPVNWYPWGDEAFEKAKELNRPVLVSIGYSTCHWCHVMEEESFEDLEVAETLNNLFICIKVDREERPDVDAVYMKVAQALTGNGGWPLNVVVSPDRDPFWAGTYFPPRNGDRGATYGFLSIIQRISQVFTQSPENIDQAKHQIRQAIQNYLSVSGSGMPDNKLLDKAIETYKNMFDSRNGGLQGAPKFPSSLPIRLLLRSYLRTKDKSLLEMSNLTLKKMASGGMYDQVGGGFHRYSTDEFWLVPHFEKMLYDNALLAITYVEAYQLTQDPFFREIATEILDYISKEMRSPEGAFFSATDADSETDYGQSEEGFYFSWKYSELKEILAKQDFDLVKKLWGVSRNGNFEGRNVLYRDEERSRLSRELGLSDDQLKSQVEKIKSTLYLQRNKRALPLRDEKIIVSWNGLMISAFAVAGSVFNNQKYVSIAVQALEFIKKNLMVDQRLFRIFKDGQVKHKAFLGDYANTISASLNLFRATHDFQWLEFAIGLDQYLEKHFEDSAEGGFYISGDDQEVVVMREKPSYDGAMPSENAVTMENLARLEALTLDSRYRSRLDNAFRLFLGDDTSNLGGRAEMLMTFETTLMTPVEIVIVTKTNKNEAKPFLKILNQLYLPHAEVIVISSEESSSDVWNPIPYANNRQLVNGQTTVFICEKGSCKLPITSLIEFENHLNDLMS